MLAAPLATAAFPPDLRYCVDHSLRFAVDFCVRRTAESPAPVSANTKTSWVPRLLEETRPMPPKQWKPPMEDETLDHDRAEGADQDDPGSQGQGPCGIQHRILLKPADLRKLVNSFQMWLLGEKTLCSPWQRVQKTDSSRDKSLKKAALGEASNRHVSLARGLISVVTTRGLASRWLLTSCA